MRRSPYTYKCTLITRNRPAQALDAAPTPAPQRAIYYANMAACCLKLSQPRLAAEHCSCALRIDGRWGAGSCWTCMQLCFWAVTGACTAPSSPCNQSPMQPVPMQTLPPCNPPPMQPVCTATSRRSCGAPPHSRTWTTPTTRWWTPKRCAVLCCAVLCCAVLCCAALCCAVM